MFLPVVVLPLLVFAPLHLSVLATRLAQTPSLGWPELAPAALFAATVLLLWAAMAIGRYGGSPAVPSAAMALLGVGMAVQYRIGSFRAAGFDAPSDWALPVGVLLMIAAYFALRRRRIEKLEGIWPWTFAASVAVILAVVVLGRSYRGAKYLPGGMNPVEIAKPLLVLFVSALLSGHRLDLRRGLLGVPLPPPNILATVAVFWLPPMLLLVLQGDLGMFAMMNATLLAMLAAVTHRSLYLTGGLAALLSLAAAAMPLTRRGRVRLVAWQDPFSCATDAGWQILQSLVALYTGGIWGTGLGAGSPRSVPIVESDFAYAMIGEELGLAGCCAVALLYAVLVVSGVRLASRARSAYASCVATGLVACLGFQTLLNLAGVTKALPLTGIPLPLVSHGGSSLVATLLSIGLLMAISDEAPAIRAPR